jgi:hypothetical protein
MSKSEWQAASTQFDLLGKNHRTEEMVEILHFLAWRQ